MPRREFPAPNTYAATPSSFGRDEKIPWKHPLTVRELVGLRGAEVQHAVAVRTRELVKDGELRFLSRLAKTAEMEPKRLSKLLCGDALMAMRDYQNLVIVLPGLLGVTVEHWVVQDPGLAERFPALAAAPQAVPGDKPPEARESPRGI